MSDDDTDPVQGPSNQPGEKGPPAWEERPSPEDETVDDEPMPDEPPDSSSEVGQAQGLPPDLTGNEDS